MKAAAATMIPALPNDPRGVVLLDEATTTVSASGEIRSTQRTVWKILTSAGRSLGEFGIRCDAETRLKSLNAWTITAKGEELQPAIAMPSRYQPHHAGDILTNHYGDCKDKVTLMRALLREAGVNSNYVLATTERRTVEPSFASVDGFNHVIVAIPLGADAPWLPAVINHPRLGKVLLFDPTSEMTPIGSLPEYLQNMSCSSSRRKAARSFTSRRPDPKTTS